MFRKTIIIFILFFSMMISSCDDIVFPTAYGQDKTVIENDDPSTCLIDAFIKRQEARLDEVGVWNRILICSWEDEKGRYGHAFLIFELNGTLWAYDKLGSSDSHFEKSKLIHLPGLAFISFFARGVLITVEIKAHYMEKTTWKK